MLWIEYVMAQRREDPIVVYRIDTKSRMIAVAEQVAHGTLDAVRRMFPATPPDGFQIFDDNDDLVFRSWEDVPLHSMLVGEHPVKNHFRKPG